MNPPYFKIAAKLPAAFISSGYLSYLTDSQVDTII